MQQPKPKSYEEQIDTFLDALYGWLDKQPKRIIHLPWQLEWKKSIQRKFNFAYVTFAWHLSWTYGISVDKALSDMDEGIGRRK